MPPPDIHFPDVPAPQYISERDCVSFPARVDGKPVKCLVSLELLWNRFGLRKPGKEAMLECFQQNRAAIQQIARAHLEMGWINPDNEVLLTRRYTRLTITYGSGLRSWAGVQALAEEASRHLIPLIGPFADEVVVDWDRGEAQARPVVTLRISDSARSVSAVFEPEELTRPWHMRVRLARAWGDFLQLRLQKRLGEILLGGTEGDDGEEPDATAQRA